MKDKKELLRVHCQSLMQKHSKDGSLQDGMKHDGAKLILNRLERDDWDTLKAWVKKQRDHMAGSNMRGPALLHQFYMEISQKMWSIDKNG